MKETAAKLKLFFSGFGLPAYTLRSVPETVTLPYIVYSIVEPRWDVPASFYAQVHYPKNMLEDLLTKADEIIAEIGEGHEITLPNGYLMIYHDNQRSITGDDEVQSAYIPLILRAYKQPGS